MHEKEGRGRGAGESEVGHKGEGGSVNNYHKSDFVKWFSELSNKDVKIAGGKGASLAEMYNIGMPVPPGFMVTAHAYKYFIEKAKLVEKIRELFTGLDMEDTVLLEKNAAEIQKLISNAEMPDELEKEIWNAYDMLDADKRGMDVAKGTALSILKMSKEAPFVAVRSSATAEDLADASFAGQQESFLNVKGKTMLTQKIKDCFASLFTARAVYYRTKKGFSHTETYLAVVVQKMIDSEKSGVMFSKNPIKNDNTIMIEAVFGLGEGIVSGRIKPDSYIVDGDLKEFKILEESVSDKKVAIVRSSSGKTEIVKLVKSKANSRVLIDSEIRTLARYGKKLEEHYKKPQDIEFAIEGGEVYIVQSRPITTLEKLKESGHLTAKKTEGKVLLSGLGASPGVASGVVKVIKDLKDLDKIKKGDVLVTIMTNPDMVVTMQKSTAIVTDEGGVTSHAAIVSREMGIPAVVGTGDATSTLKDGMIVTVDGLAGKVYEGKGETQEVVINQIVHTKTKIKVLVDLPDFAERAAKCGAKAVGLVRIEGIIAESGKHPMAYVKQNKIGDYVEILFNGLKRIAMPFEEIWIRTSDIRSDEFRNLEGTPKEVEGNPMLGNHGVRYSLKHKEIMEAELNAVKKLAHEFPMKIFGVMMPQVISVSEVEQTKKIASQISMPANVKIGIMVETPAAVQIINELCEAGIKFASFGTNDLTQYTLAIDRNNTGVQDLYDEMNPAVLNSLSYVIRRCKNYGVETSICGQAGSNENMAKFLVQEGIDSISVNADAAEKVSKIVAEIEKQKLEQIKNKKEEEQQRISLLHSKNAEFPMFAVHGFLDNVDKRLNELSEDIENIILRELDAGEKKQAPVREEKFDEKNEVKFSGVDSKINNVRGNLVNNKTETNNVNGNLINKTEANAIVDNGLVGKANISEGVDNIIISENADKIVINGMTYVRADGNFVNNQTKNVNETFINKFEDNKKVGEVNLKVNENLPVSQELIREEKIARDTSDAFIGNFASMAVLNDNKPRVKNKGSEEWKKKLAESKMREMQKMQEAQKAKQMENIFDRDIVVKEGGEVKNKDVKTAENNNMEAKVVEKVNNSVVDDINVREEEPKDEMSSLF